MSNIVEQKPEVKSHQESAFVLAQREANALASSSLVPKDYQNNPANCLLAINMSRRIGIEPLTVMQNLHVINGKPGWSSSFMIAVFNSNNEEKFSDLRFEMSEQGCRAYAIDLKTNKEVYGPMVTMQMAQAEGWSTKTGSKWKTMPELMMMYRAAAFFIRLYAPNLVMGIHTAEEIQDIGVKKIGSIEDQPVQIESKKKLHTLETLESPQSEVINDAEDGTKQGELSLD